MIEDKKLKYLGSKDDVDFYEFKASLFHYFYTLMAYYEKLFSRMVRETIDFIMGGYRVIYIAKENHLVGYGIITRGGGRNKFCSSKDAVICSLWIDETQRGQGLGKVLVEIITDVVHSSGIETAYMYIRHDNEPSRKSALHNGYEFVTNATTVGKLHKVCECKDGRLGIYKNKK